MLPLMVREMQLHLFEMASYNLESGLATRKVKALCCLF